MKDNFQKKKFRNEYHKLYGNIIYTGSFMIAGLQQQLEKFQITHPQFTTLRILQISSPEPLSMSEVKENMLDRNSDLTRLVDRLVEKGLVVRMQDTINRRKINLSLSEKGIALLNSIDVQMQEYDKIIHDFDLEEIKNFNAFLSKLRQRLIQYNEN